MTTVISADLFNLIANFRSNEEIRYYLCGVYAEPNPKGPGVILTATDGHVLGSILDPDGFCDESCMIKFNKALTPPKARKGSRATYKIVVHANTAYLALGDFTQAEAAKLTPSSPTVYAAVGNITVDGSFPDWRRVIPAATSRANTSALNLAELARFLPVAKTHSKYAVVALFAEGAECPVIVRTECPDFLGVVMPVRSDITSGKRPEWF